MLAQLRKCSSYLLIKHQGPFINHVDGILDIFDPPPPLHSATEWSICGTYGEGILLEILMVFSNFIPKNYHFGHIYFKKSSKIHKIDDFGCKI